MRSEKLTVSELIDILKDFPQDSPVFISSLCMGYLRTGNIIFKDEKGGTVVFTGREKKK